ncbi:acid phosphatase [Neolentinus lepideus HHB14362 ss-1]|uniref:Phytase A n=1 Tax=Neolentinus lepideus HHB14362 ss-1 TaxID=1314782 RepID=A0A165UBI1_9AGAM|nr:acid phosphatase [Neolentinus lepideus HHB14362 ss-1]
MSKETVESELPFTTGGSVQQSNVKQTQSKLRGVVLCALLFLDFAGFKVGGYICDSWSRHRHNAGKHDITKHWAQYTPYVPAGDYVPPPKHCKVTQVNLLQRHGARYPSSDDPVEMEEAISKLQQADEYKDKSLEFLRNHSYFLGQDDLIPLGAEQSFQSGIDIFDRYSRLVSKGNLPFVRASGQDRVVDTARNWTAGFATASRYEYEPHISVIIPEDKNDTLQINQCPSAPSYHPYTETWRDIFIPPIKHRLNKAAPGAHLNNSNVYSLMALCPLESVALSAAEWQFSRFCGLFTEKEWKQFEWHEDLKKYYKTGYGNPLGPVQGVGYVNELLARLTNNAVSDHTNTNATLDSSPETFPLNHTIYADFTHENLLVAVFGAMGLFNQSTTLNPRHVGKKHRTWNAHKMVPFSARMVVEKMECEKWPGLSEETSEFVRVFVNDEMQPLDFCGTGEGVCTLNAFSESQKYAKDSGQGDWEKCFEEEDGDRVISAL